MPVLEQSQLLRWQDVQRFAKGALIRGRWLLGVLSFYGDESGSHGDGPFVLSGYLARDDDWTAFQEAWHAALHAGREIQYFHMRECFKLEGEFQGFNRFQADRKLNELIDALCPFLRSQRLAEFTATLDWDIYNRAVTGPLRDTYHTPYFFGLHPIIAEMAKFLEANPTWAGDAHGPVDFFFDDQTARVEHDAAKQFYDVKDTVLEEYTRYMGDIAFRNDTINYPLQAADLIAWQSHRFELNLPEDRGKRPEYRKLRNATVANKIMTCREKPIQALSERVAAGLRAGVWE